MTRLIKHSSDKPLIHITPSGDKVKICMCGISKTYYDTGELKSETNFIEFVPGSVSGAPDDKQSHIIVKNYLKNGEMKDKVEFKYGEVIKS